MKIDIVRLALAHRFEPPASDPDAAPKRCVNLVLKRGDNQKWEFPGGEVVRPHKGPNQAIPALWNAQMGTGLLTWSKQPVATCLISKGTRRVGLYTVELPAGTYPSRNPNIHASWKWWDISVDPPPDMMTPSTIVLLNQLRKLAFGKQA